MQEYTLSGDFDFNTRNIESTNDFCVTLRINVPDINREQHIYIKQTLSEKLGLRAHSVPEPWGDGPVPYYEINFETKDLSYCKHLIGLLKEGNVDLKAAGRRYPLHSDHPLFAKIDPLQDEAPVLKDFASLNALIGITISESYEKFANPTFPSTETPSRPAYDAATPENPPSFGNSQ